MPSRLELEKFGDQNFLVSPFREDPPTDNSSLLVVSLAKRQVADELLYNTTKNVTGIDPLSPDVYAVNVRKFYYSITIGRLHWQLQNLSDIYSATCAMSASPLACMGLKMPLSPPVSTTSEDRGSSKKETLIVGATALPHQPVTTKGLDGMIPQSLPLVRIREPPKFSRKSRNYETITGDPLLPCNIKRFPWKPNDPLVDLNICSGGLEDRYRTILNRHMYMEYGLQTAYTSAIFFLFQNGVVKEDISLSDGSESLKFAKNQQDIAVHLSIPWLNVMLTSIGCTVLVTALGGVALFSRYKSSTKMDTIQNPDAIARVLKDEVQFPPFLLYRDVVIKDDELPPENVEQFTIESLTLTRRNGHGIEHWVACTKPT